MKKFIIASLLIFTGFGISAQFRISHQPVNLNKSYFISFEGDTVYGDIEYGKRLFGGLLTKIYYTDPDGNRFLMRANESNGFAMLGQNYVSKIIDDFYYFLRPAVSGGPSLYYLEQNFVKRNRVPLEMIRVQGAHGRMMKVYLESNGKMHKMYRKRFNRQAEGLFAAYPEIIEQIDAGELSFFDLEEIVTYCNMVNEGLMASGTGIGRR